MTLKIGWIGCGRHASQMLLPQMGRNGLRIEAVADLDEAKAGLIAEQYGISNVYKDFRDLVAHPGLDAIGMAVGPALHQQAGIHALERGLPVFMEKPPAADLAGAIALDEAAKRAGKPVVLGFMKRYSTANAMARNIVCGEEFGSVLGITGTYMTAPTYFEREVDYSGFYLHHCVHYMDLIPWLADAEIAEMSVKSVEPTPGKLLFHLCIEFSTGAIGTIVMGTVQSRGNPVEHIQIMGDHRRIEIENVINIRYLRDPEFKVENTHSSLANDQDALVWSPNFTAAANEDHKGYNALIADFARVLKNEPNNAPTISDGVKAMARLDQMIHLLRR